MSVSALNVPRTSRPVPAFRPAMLPTVLEGNNAHAMVSGSFWIRVSSFNHPIQPTAMGRVSVNGYGIGNGSPTIKTGTVKVYEEGTNKLVATVKNPQLRLDSVDGVSRTRALRFDVPVSKLDLTKRYTFVVEAALNGANRLLQVRSPYTQVMQAP